MRFIVIVLVLASLGIMLAGCSSNDKNTVNSIPKHHFVYPVFHLAFDNGHSLRGIDSVQLSFEPTQSGYRVYNTIYDTVITKVFHSANDGIRVDSVYRSDVVVTTDSANVPNFGPSNGIQIFSDQAGFIGGLAAGTYYTGAYLMIDTIYVKRDSATGTILPGYPDTTRSVDTTSVHFGFEPLGQYSFHFTRPEPFGFRDSIRLDYARTIDSTWEMLSFDTIRVSDSVDPLRTPQLVVDSIAIIPEDNLLDTLVENQYGLFPTVTKQGITYGLWFDTVVAVIEPGQVYPIPPTSTFTDTVYWGTWNRIDTFFVPADSSIWCQTGIRVDTIEKLDANKLPMIVLDTVTIYTHCIDGSPLSRARKRTYKHNGWGSYDTTLYFFYPDTLKRVIFTADSVMIVNTETNDTGRAIIQFNNGDSTILVPQLQNRTITLPGVEEFPDYRITIKAQ
jgi:hypothetical protein